MPKGKILKLVGLNVGIVLLNIVLFSQGLLNIHLKGSGAFETALGGALLFMSLAAFIYGNYTILMKKDKAIQLGEINTTEDCINSLKQAYGKSTFDGDISIILDQVVRLKKKIETVKQALLKRFNIMDAGYEKFNSAIFDAEYVFITNIKSILNKINVFDEEDYHRIKNNPSEAKFSADLLHSKLVIYNEYITYVKGSIEDNEQVILKLDKLLLEISKLDSMAEGEFENMGEIKGIDELTKKTKFYK